MKTQQEILSELIARNTGELTDERLRELRSTAATLASLGGGPEITRKAPPDRKTAARAKLAELDAKPLPAGSNDAAKCTRAAARAEQLAIIHDLEGYHDHNGHLVRTGPPKDAA